MKCTRLETGLYKVEQAGLVFIVEDVTHDAGKRIWHISEYVVNENGRLYREPPFDAASSLKEAKELIAGW